MTVHPLAFVLSTFPYTQAIIHTFCPDVEVDISLIEKLIAESSQLPVKLFYSVSTNAAVSLHSAVKFMAIDD